MEGFLNQQIADEMAVERRDIVRNLRETGSAPRHRKARQPRAEVAQLAYGGNQVVVHSEKVTRKRAFWTVVSKSPPVCDEQCVSL